MAASAKRAAPLKTPSISPGNLPYERKTQQKNTQIGTSMPHFEFGENIYPLFPLHIITLYGA